MIQEGKPMKKLAVFWMPLICVCLAACCANAMELKERNDFAPFGYNYVLAEDGFIYYNVQTEENSFSLYRMSSAGESAEMLLPVEADYFAIANDVIYFNDILDSRESSLGRWRDIQIKEKLSLFL